MWLCVCHVVASGHSCRAGHTGHIVIHIHPHYRYVPLLFTLRFLIRFGSRMQLIHLFQSLLSTLPIARITFIVKPLHSHIIQ
jgi:hypothetical protein